MQTEQPWRDEAGAYYVYQYSIYRFHDKLREFYHFVKKHCDDIPDIKCGNTPKLICLRSVREHPPVRCKLSEAGYFPLMVDYKFAQDVGRDSVKPPIKVTEIHIKRFKDAWANVKCRLIKKKEGPPSDPSSNTIVGVSR